MDVLRLVANYAWLIHKNAFYTVWEFLAVNGWFALATVGYLATLQIVWQRAKEKVTKPARRLGY